MPQFEPKVIQKEIEQGQLRPLYFFVGKELLKAKELYKRIKNSFEATEHKLNATEVSVDELMDLALTPSLFGGVPLILVRGAQALKEVEKFEALASKGSLPKAECHFVVVCFADELDGRKKSTKWIQEKTCVVSCEEVGEHEREAWIQYLAKRRGLTLTQNVVWELVQQDPWNLEIMEQELEKLSLQGVEPDEGTLVREQKYSARAFVDAFYKKDKATSLRMLKEFVFAPEESFSLVGLLNWNLKKMIEDKSGSSGFYQSKTHSHLWSVKELIALQEKLLEVDFSLKQKPLSELGVWTQFIH